MPDKSEKVSKYKSAFFKSVVILGIVLAISILSVISHFNNEIIKNNTKAGQTKNDGEIVEIDGIEWKRGTFYDADDRCWKIYTSVDNTKDKSIFVIPCKKE